MDHNTDQAQAQEKLDDQYWAARLKLFDVIATNIKTGTVRVIAENKTQATAEAIVKMAVMRRGVSEEFFSVRKGEGAGG